jgi:hypothetical protein
MNRSWYLKLPIVRPHKCGQSHSLPDHKRTRHGAMCHQRQYSWLRGKPHAAEPLALWLAFHARPTKALALLEESQPPSARRLAGLILAKALDEPSRALPFLETGPLHDPVAVAELDGLYADLGLSDKRATLLARTPAHRLITERRADLAALQLLQSTLWPREHQRYTRSTLWRKARTALGLPGAEIPAELGEDNLAVYGPYWSSQSSST